MRTWQRVQTALAAFVFLAVCQPAIGDTSDSAVRAVDDNSTYGMSGSNVRGMSGSNVRGMSGSNVRGMSGSNVRGMSGSNVRGMSGSNVRGMSGSNVRSGGAGLAFESAAMGPVEIISQVGDAAQITVLGQTYTTTADVADEVREGDYVVLAGNSAGELEVLYPVGLDYVPGASSVLVRGAVKGSEPAIANLSIGNAVFDYSSHLSVEPTYVPSSGDIIEVKGIQPVVGGKIVIGAHGRALITQGGTLGLSSADDSVSKASGTQ